MNPSQDRLMAHARVVRARGSALPPGGTLPGDILDSWVRCAQVGLDGAAPMQVQVVEAADLAMRRERAAFVRRLAQAELETLAPQIAGSNFLLAFADNDGVILDLYADNRFTMSGSDAGILPGSRWSEDLAGTNGLGTALASGASVAVNGLEHYFLKLGDISCTAAPIRDSNGDVVGVLDASSYFESRQRHTQALVQMAATHIENGLLVHQMRAQMVLAIHPRAEFLGTLSAGLLAFDGAGRVVALNQRSRQLLSGLAVASGTTFDELFGEPYEHLLARLHQRDEVRLRDALGSALVATCVSRPWVSPVSSASLALPTIPRSHRERVARGHAAQPRPAGDPPFVAGDPAVAQACATVAQAVRMNVPILIQGETGTGKELLARYAHEASGRAGAFVAVNCGALSSELVEAELFGYVGGAFTGARREGSVGLLVSADGGTVLLDEVRELPPALQATLLRFLDDQTVRPVGGTATRRVDVQVLAATNVELLDEVAARRFRSDLLYRLNTVRVDLPPLHARRDFGAAVHAVLEAIDRRATISADAVQRLALQPWPGNFRELRSVLTRALLARPDHALERADIERVLPAASMASAASGLQQHATELVQREFERNSGSVSQTARALGISRTTVYRHLRELAGRRSP